MQRCIKQDVVSLLLSHTTWEFIALRLCRNIFNNDTPIKKHNRNNASDNDTFHLRWHIGSKNMATNAIYSPIARIFFKPSSFLFSCLISQKDWQGLHQLITIRLSAMQTDVDQIVSFGIGIVWLEPYENCLFQVC